MSTVSFTTRPPLLTAQVGRKEVCPPLQRPQTLLAGVPGVPGPLQLAGCAPHLPCVDGIERPPYVAPSPPAESLVSGLIFRCLQPLRADQAPPPAEVEGLAAAYAGQGHADHRPARGRSCLPWLPPLKVAPSWVPLPPSGGPRVEYWFPGVPAPL